MSHRIDKQLTMLSECGADLLSGSHRGIEKESLRVDEAGRLSKTSHPKALGSALTNRFITTDFSEALLEFVTPAFASTWEAARALCDVHQFVHERIRPEMLWPASMPCPIPGDGRIPLARYGSSNVGTMKTTYRRGLGYRYGRQMQTIAGVHYNFSLPEDFWPVYQQLTKSGGSESEFRSAAYLGLVRNFRRFGWILLYLFGASPALCRSFAMGRDLDMPLLSETTYFEPFGTSLRMSDLGYSNKNQSRIHISLNRLDEYIRDLTAAMHTPEPEYEEIGVAVDGVYRQLSANQLQIENEYYSPVRPKRVAHSGERPTRALSRGGIEYVEVRSLDCNLYDPIGINQNTMRFVEAFLVYCLLQDSPLFDEALLDECIANQTRVAKRGRDPGCMLEDRGRSVPLPEWARAINADVARIAEYMDGGDGDYSAAVEAMQARIEDPAQTPSAQILADLEREGISFFELAFDAAQKHQAYFASLDPLDERTSSLFENEAAASLRRQADIEASDTLSFEEYLDAWFAAN